MNTTGKIIATGGILGAMVAIGVGAWRLLSGPDRVVKAIEPDALPMMPAQGRTGYKRIDAILDKLRAVSQSTGIPLGLMVGWIAKESGGKLADTTSLNEKGLYQLMPDESKTLGIDHDRLSTDLDYSIDAGTKLIRHYQSAASDLNLPAAPAGSVFAWKLCKLGHSMGGGQLRKVVKAAQAAGQAGSWDQLEQFALGMSINGPQPKKWFPFVDSVYTIGRPFGFGNEPALVAGFTAVGGFEDHLPMAMHMGQLAEDDLGCGFDSLGAEEEA